MRLAADIALQVFVFLSSWSKTNVAALRTVVKCFLSHINILNRKIRNTNKMQCEHFHFFPVYLKQMFQQHLSALAKSFFFYINISDGKMWKIKVCGNETGRYGRIMMRDMWHNWFSVVQSKCAIVWRGMKRNLVFRIFVTAVTHTHFSRWEKDEHEFTNHDVSKCINRHVRLKQRRLR